MDTQLTGKTLILASTNTKKIRKYLEAANPTQSAFNKHIETDPIYQPIKKTINNLKVTSENVRRGSK